MTFANTTRLYIETTRLNLSILDLDVFFYISLMTCSQMLIVFYHNVMHGLGFCYLLNNKYLFLRYLAPTMSGVTSPTMEEKEFINLNLYTQQLL